MCHEAVTAANSREEKHQFELDSGNMSQTPHKNHVCDFCGRAFQSTSSLKNHRKWHILKKDQECVTCGKAFFTQSSLNAHKCAGQKDFSCDVCGKTFTTKALLGHHEAIHSGKKPHVCDVCGSAFLRFETLKKHRMRHTGEKNHVCDLCGRAFLQLGAMKRHRRLHARPSETTADLVVQDDMSSVSEAGGSFVINDDSESNRMLHTCASQGEMTTTAVSVAQDDMSSTMSEAGSFFGEEDPKSVNKAGSVSTVPDLQSKKQVKLSPKDDPGNVHQVESGENVNEVESVESDEAENSMTPQSYSDSAHGVCDEDPVTPRPEFAQGKACDGSPTLSMILVKRRHRQAGAKNEKNYTCEFCLKSFTQGSLSRHRKIHLGQKNHKCSVCGKAFIQACSLKKHMSIHSEQLNLWGWGKQNF
jgi:KRAB domain-containing zinc finger protein